MSTVEVWKVPKVVHSSLRSQVSSCTQDTVDALIYVLNGTKRVRVAGHFPGSRVTLDKVPRLQSPLRSVFWFDVRAVVMYRHVS